MTRITLGTMSEALGNEQAVKVRDLTGPGVTTRFGMEGTDLGICARTPSGRTLAVFGDTFAGPGMGAPFVGTPHPGLAHCSPTTDERPGPGNPDWRSPVGLFSDTRSPSSGLEWVEAAGPGPGDYAGQLVDYVHCDFAASQKSGIQCPHRRADQQIGDDGARGECPKHADLHGAEAPTPGHHERRGHCRTVRTTAPRVVRPGSLSARPHERSRRCAAVVTGPRLARTPQSIRFRN